MRLLLWAIVALGLAFGLAWWFGGDRPILLGFQPSEFGQLLFLLLLLMWIAVALGGRALSPGYIIRAATFWVLLGLVLIGGYTYREELGSVGGRVLGALAPGLPVAGDVVGEDGERSVIITRGAGAHFGVIGDVEGHRVSFLVDTGASFVTLTTHEARRIGIDVDSLRFTLPIRTANGLIRAAEVKIDRLAVGSIERFDVDALVSPQGTLSQSLLGLSFLDSLASYTVAGDRLILTP